MPSSPLTPSPYEVLGVAPSASDDELRKAYRRMLRATHPDTGGDPKRFHEVQHAWDLVGTPEERARYDRGRGAQPESRATWAPAPPRPRGDSRPSARSYGHPGGLRREQYLTHIREWAGRGAALPDPYDPALVRTAPRNIRHLLADAVAEERTARQLATLGIAYTVWNDVAAGDGVAKIDHVVLGPSGLIALQSEDWGEAVTVKRNEIVGEALLAGERPLHALAVMAKNVGRAARVRFTALAVVVPDDAIDDDLTVGRMRGLPAAVVRRSRLPGVMRDGLPASPAIGGTELFEVRTRLQSSIRFV